MITKDTWRKRNPDKAKKNAVEYYSKNKETLLAYSKSYYQSNIDKVQERHSEYYELNKVKARNSKLKNRYKLTREEYDSMLEQQDNCCACCGEPFIRTPHVDHNHTTGKVRGLLCAGCNTGLGQYEKKNYLFEDYLIKFGNGDYFDK